MILNNPIKRQELKSNIYTEIGLYNCNYKLTEILAGFKPDR